MRALFPAHGPLYYLLFAAVALLFGGLLFAPFSEGCAAFFYCLVRYGRRNFAEFFAFFLVGKRFRYALARYLCRLSRTLFFLAVFFSIAILGNGVGGYLAETGALARGALVLGGTLCFLLLLLVLYVRFSYRTYLMGAARFSVPALSFRSVGTVSSVGMRHRYGKVLCLDLSFLPLFIFSFLLLGIPLIFVIPHYLAAKAEMCFGLLSLENQ